MPVAGVFAIPSDDSVMLLDQPDKVANRHRRGAGIPEASQGSRLEDGQGLHPAILDHRHAILPKTDSRYWKGRITRCQYGRPALAQNVVGSEN